MKKEKQKVPLCLYEEDGINCSESSEGGARGLCHNHYISARYHVKKGNTSWEELEEKGRARKALTQAEKNINQMHPHDMYKTREKNG